jgi:hypothetical protein
MVSAPLLQEDPMLTVVVYESMFGNTHVIADHIGSALSELGDVRVVPVGEASGDLIAGAGLVVVGGPTHVHGMARTSSQHAALEQAEADPDLDLDPDAEGELLRQWFEDLGTVADIPAAAFDTRVGVSAVMSGRASKGIDKRLARHGFRRLVPPESFLVDKHNHLLDGEAARAGDWASRLVAAVATTG